ncbi:MAG: nuclear transport factor 2 family protein [Pseudomonadales bacterium]|jgi:ketosteroid isomerase-like protein|nr:nuclear transport factor 2 family protein [Pseudomonadales bacterium]
MSHEALMRDYYRTYNSEDPAALRAFYHEDVVLVSAQGEMHGPDAILDSYRFLTGQFLDRMTPTHIAVDGDTAVVAITDRFTARVDVADFMGVALKKGESLDLSLRGTYTIDGGKFRRIVIEPV